jgi:FMN phosphatase YigB (HAD superfamily)
VAGPPIEAVTFDYWNTLVGEDPTVFEYRRVAVTELVGEQVPDLDPKRVAAAFEHGWQAYTRAWKANEPFAAPDAVPIMLAFLGVDDPSEALVDGLLQIIVDPPDERRPPLTPNIAETLATLRQAGMRLGIICDVGLTPSTALRRWLGAHGVLEHFDHWSFSDEVGVFKPDPVIFRHALDGLGAAAGRVIDPGRAAHVGDLRRTDIAGAKAFGMTAVRYTGMADDPVVGGFAGDSNAEGDFVITDHAELPKLLGIG